MLRAGAGGGIGFKPLGLDGAVVYLAQAIFAVLNFFKRVFQFIPPSLKRVCLCAALAVLLKLVGKLV